MEGLAGYASDGEDGEANAKSGVAASMEDPCSHGGVDAAQLETEWEMFQKMLGSDEDLCNAKKDSKDQASICASNRQDDQNADSDEHKLTSEHAEDISHQVHACGGLLPDQVSQDVKLDGFVATQVSEKAGSAVYDPQHPINDKQLLSRSSSPMSMDLSQNSDPADDTSFHSGDQANNGDREGELPAADVQASASMEDLTKKALDITEKASSTKSSSRSREIPHGSTADTKESTKPRSRVPSGQVSKQSTSHSRSRSSSAARSRLHEQTSRSRIFGRAGKHRSNSRERRSPSRDRKRLPPKKDRSQRSRSRSGPRSRRSRQQSSSKSPSRRSHSRSRRSRSKPKPRRSRSRSRRSRSNRSRSKSRRSRSHSRRSKSRSPHSRSRRSRSRSHKKSRSDLQRHPERRRKPVARVSRPGARNRSGSRHRSRSRRRSRSRSVNRTRRANRSRSRVRSRSRDHSRSRDRSRSASRSGHRRSSSIDKGRSPSGKSAVATVKAKVPVQEPHVDFKTKMKMELQKAAKDALEGKCIIDQKSLMTSEKPSLSAILMCGTSEKVTAQQAMMHTLAAMHAKAQELTGVAIPKYYNPAAVNPLKYAEQMQKRKLLWSKTKDTKEATAQWQGTSVVVDEKFRKLMGIREGEVEVGELSEEQLQKQAELFAKLDQEYAFARMATHTHRGMGLGAVSTGAASSTYSPAEPQPSQPKGGI